MDTCKINQNWPGHSKCLAVKIHFPFSKSDFTPSFAPRILDFAEIVTYIRIRSNLGWDRDLRTYQLSDSFFNWWWKIIRVIARRSFKRALSDVQSCLSSVWSRWFPASRSSGCLRIEPSDLVAQTVSRHVLRSKLLPITSCGSTKRCLPLRWPLLPRLRLLFLLRRPLPPRCRQISTICFSYRPW